jgi:hypothetical protein
MFLTVHSTAGLALAASTGNPILAFMMGVLSHYFLDMIPHGDENIDKFLPNTMDFKLKVAIWATGDFLLVLVLWLTIFKALILTYPVVFLSGALGAMAPDMLQGFSILFKLKILRLHEKFHNAAHRLLNNPVPFRYGIIIQIAFFSGLLYQLF